jgi:hypothetical protein
MRWWHWSLLGAVVAATLAVDQITGSEHDYWFSGIPGFWVAFGFAGCVAIILLSKWYGKLWVQRSEDYYSRHGDLDPHRARTGVPDAGAEGDGEAER